jgi:hypothetical protein
MSNTKKDLENLTLEDLIRSESEVLDRIAHEIDFESTDVFRGRHTSHHSGSHQSTTARVERVGHDADSEKKPA